MATRDFILYLLKAGRLIRHTVVEFIGRKYLSLQGLKAGKKLTLHGIPIVTLANHSTITIGDRVVLCSKSINTALGVQHPVILRTLEEEAEIIIGDDVGVSGGSICAARKIYIGSQTMLGANVIVTDTDFHPLSPKNRRYNRHNIKPLSKEVIIRENVFIGANSIILKGVTIGENSVIGAGSIVTSDIPANVIASGNPCQVIRPIKEEFNRSKEGPE